MWGETLNSEEKKMWVRTFRVKTENYFIDIYTSDLVFSETMSQNANAFIVV